MQTPTPFDQLQEVPRPWLDPDALKAKFLKLGAPLHPDRVHHLSEREKREATRRFTELNAAYLTLRNPRDRLNLLLELESGSKPGNIQKITTGIAGLFAEIGQLCRELDAHLAARNPAETSPLLKAAALRAQHEWLARLHSLRFKVDARAASARMELQKLDAEWMSSADHKPLLERLEHMARLFSYIERWKQLLANRLIQLKTT